MDNKEDKKENVEYYNSTLLFNKDTNNSDYIKSVQTINSYGEIAEISESYLLILNEVYKNNQSISKNDFLVIKSLIFEGTKLSNLLFEKGHIEESKEMIDLMTKLINILILSLLSYTDIELNTESDHLKNILFLFSLKIHVVEVQFQIYFYMQLFEDCEKILDELMKVIIQTNLPKFKIGSCLFFQAIIKLYLKKDCNITNKLVESESIALEALKYFENIDINHNKSIANMIIKKLSLIFEFLGTLAEIRNNNNSALSYYEKAYYLNLGYNGNHNLNTEYYRVKLNIVANSSNSLRSLPILDDPQFKKSYQFNGVTNSTISKFSNETSYTNITQNQNEIKGSTKTFKFIVPYTYDYEPLIIKLYENSEEEIFVKNIYLEKKQLINHFANLFKSILSTDIYNKNLLSQIIKNIALDKGKVIYSNIAFKNLIINK